MLNITPISTIKKCSRCGNKLALTKKKKQKLEGYSHPVVISTYKCSNKICQDQIDRDLKQWKKDAITNKINDELKGKRVNLRLKKASKTS